MTNLDPQLLDALFNEYFKNPSFVDNPKGAGYCVYLTLRDGTEKVICAPSAKYKWEMKGHAKAAFRDSYQTSYIYKKITGQPVNRAECDEIWKYFWTRLKIKRLVDKDILSAINLLKQAPPDVVGALNILEKL